MKCTGNPNRRGSLRVFAATSAVLVGMVSARDALAVAPLFDNMSGWDGTNTSIPLPTDFGLYFSLPNPAPTTRPPDSLIADTALGNAYTLQPGSVSLTGIDFTFANATDTTGLATNPSYPNYVYPQYNGGAGTTFNALKITVSIWGSVTPVSQNASGGYVGLNSSNQAFSNLLSTQTIYDTTDTTAPSGYVYIYDGYGLSPGLRFNSAVSVAGLTEVGITYDLQGSTDGGLTYQHYAGLDPIIGADAPQVVGSTAFNAFYTNDAGETNGNFTEGPHYYQMNYSGTTMAIPQQAVAARVYGVGPAVNYSWINAADGVFSDDSQWSPDGVPGGNDNTFFNLGSTTGYTVEIPDVETCANMSIQNDNVNLNLDAYGSHLFVNSTLIVGQPATTGAAGKGTLSLVNTVGINTGLMEANAVIVGSNGGTGTINVTSGVIFYVDTDLAINAGSKVAVGAFGELNTGTLTLGGTTNAWQGQLDIGNGTAVLRNASIGTVINQLKTGLNKGTWTGQGIVSSTAAADSTHLTAVGVIVNNNGSGGKIYGSGTALGLFSGDDIDGNDPDLNAVLLRYTYFGDANLDGKVDATDYSRIDSGFLTNATGWYNGDFNYDGVINGADYTLIDNAFNRQDIDPLSSNFLTANTVGSLHATLGDSTDTLHSTDIPYSAAGTAANPTATLTAEVGGAAVPEPTTLGLLAIGAIPMLGRRRRMAVK